MTSYVFEPYQGGPSEGRPTAPGKNNYEIFSKHVIILVSHMKSGLEKN